MPFACGLERDTESHGPHLNPKSTAKYMERIQEIIYELKNDQGWIFGNGYQSKFYVQKNGEYKNGENFTPAPRLSDVYLLL